MDLKACLKRVAFKWHLNLCRLLMLQSIAVYPVLQISWRDYPEPYNYLSIYLSACLSIYLITYKLLINFQRKQMIDFDKIQTLTAFLSLCLVFSLWQYPWPCSIQHKKILFVSWTFFNCTESIQSQLPGQQSCISAAAKLFFYENKVGGR